MSRPQTNTERTTCMYINATGLGGEDIDGYWLNYHASSFLYKIYIGFYRFCDTYHRFIMQAREKQSKAQSVSPANIHYVINKDKEIDIPTYMNTSQLKDQLKYPKTRPLYVDSDDDDVSIFDFTVSCLIYFVFILEIILVQQINN